jgi:dethiobiotin synthetase
LTKCQGERMATNFCITSTGFGCGKTLAAAIICKHLVANNQSFQYYEPIATGQGRVPRSIDFLRRYTQGDKSQFQFGIVAKNLANNAVQLQEQYDQRKINEAINQFAGSREMVFVEAYGGVLSSITDYYTTLDFIMDNALNIILVIPLDYNYESHYRTALESIYARGLAVNSLVVNRQKGITNDFYSAALHKVKDETRIPVALEIDFFQGWQIGGRQWPEQLQKLQYKSIQL